MGIISEGKIQQDCIMWFKNEYLDLYENEGLIDYTTAKYLRMLLHGNQNEIPVSLINKLPKRVRVGFEAWFRKIKSMGLVAGVADISFKYPVLYEGVKYNFLEIEFKTYNGVQSEKQKTYQKAVEQVGGLYKIIRSLEEFQLFFMSFLYVSQQKEIGGSQLKLIP